MNNTPVAAGAHYRTEAERMQAIESYARTMGLPGHDALIEAARRDGVSTPGDLAVRIVQAERAAMQFRAAAAAGANASSDGGRPAGLYAADSHEASQRAAAEWEGSAALRAEFRDKSSYVAYRRAQAQGRTS